MIKICHFRPASFHDFNIKVCSSYPLCVECFSQLSFDSEMYTKSATAADFVYTSESNEGCEKHSTQRLQDELTLVTILKTLLQPFSLLKISRSYVLCYKYTEIAFGHLCPGIDWDNSGSQAIFQWCCQCVLELDIATQQLPSEPD